MKNAKRDVYHYIGQFPPEVQERLQRVRQMILENAPNVVEKMAYGMPAYQTHNKPLIYYGGFKNHIGIYALPSGHEAFKNELAGYKTGKGSVQFPHDQPCPYDLIAKMVKFRVDENNKAHMQQNTKS